MSQLESLNHINFHQLDQGQFFQSLLQEIYTRNLLSQEKIEKIQLELIELLGKETERFTNGESSSVRIEKAQEILQSVTYCLGIYLKEMSETDDLLEILKAKKISVLFYKGMDTVNIRILKAKQLLSDVQKGRLKINNYAYQDTISHGIPEFFHDYQVEFGAHDMPCSIDYQLCFSVDHLIGVEYIYEYLRRFKLEQDFISQFSEEKIESLLSGFHKDSEHMLINIFELVFINVLGCAMLNLSIDVLDIPVKERSWLRNQLVGLNKEEILIKLTNSFHKVFDELLPDTEIKTYALEILPQLAVRVCNNLQTDSLQEIFISFIDQSVEKAVYIDGIPMEDEKLRLLIEELSDTELISEKIAKIRESVQSLEDMAVLLEECFYGSEYTEVFGLFTETERTLLKDTILRDAGLENAEDYEPETEWQQLLFLYE
jgi:hypothetical protein